MSWSARSVSLGHLVPFTTRNAPMRGSQRSPLASYSSLSAPVDSCDNHPSRWRPRHVVAGAAGFKKLSLKYREESHGSNQKICGGSDRHILAHLRGVRRGGDRGGIS